MKREGTNYFRPAAPLEISPVWIGLLGAFDVILVGHIILTVWRMAS